MLRCVESGEWWIDRAFIHDGSIYSSVADDHFAEEHFIPGARGESTAATVSAGRPGKIKRSQSLSAMKGSDEQTERRKRSKSL